MIRYFGALAGAILCLASIGGIGFALARWLRAGEPSDARPARPRLGWAFLLGAAAVGLVLHVPLAIDGQISHRSFAIVAIVGLAALAWSIANWWHGGPLQRKALWGWLGDLPIVGRILAIVAIAAAFAYCCRTDLTGYDARSIYAMKARILYESGTIHGEDFQDIHRVHFNPAYPLLLPLVEAQVYWMQGGSAATGLKLLFLCFSLSLVSIYAGQLRRLGGRGMAAVGALGLLFTPIVLECFEGAGLSGSTDLPLATLIFAGAMELSRWIRRPSWRPALSSAILLGAAAAMKSEGVVWIAACGVGLAGISVLRPAWPDRRRLTTALVGGCTLLLLLGVRQMVLRQLPNSPYYPSYFAAVDWRWIRQLGDRPAVVLHYGLAELARAKFWNLLWPCTIGSLVLLRRGRLPAEIWFWRLTMLAGIGAMLAALVITPLHLEYELRTSFTRLLLHAFPLAILIMSEQMAASGWSGQLADVMRASDDSDGASQQSAHRDTEAVARAA